jgi:hypothetical protein
VKGTVRVSVIAHYLSFRTGILWGKSRGLGKKAKRNGQKGKTPGVDRSSSGVNFLAFLTQK